MPPEEEAGADGERRDGPEEGWALCLSGGGYRAMLFHVGALWRLNEVGFLPKLDRISSVSGGSITSATLGVRWADLDFDPHGIARGFTDLLVGAIRRLASRTIDVPAILGGVLLAGTVGQRVSRAYRKHLFGDKTVQDLPDRPRFVINATNLQTGALWRFSKPYMGDWRVGRVHNPCVPLADAVAASSAFPPVLSPMVLDLDPDAFDRAGSDLKKPGFRRRVVLSDGGVYDNLGLETAWKRYTNILVSDGGGQLEPMVSPRQDWIRQSVRVLSVIDNQVRSLRKRDLIESYRQGERGGTYWGIRTDIADYRLPDALDAPIEKTTKLAETPTRLKAMPPELQERLINWGYAVCDAALRTHVDPTLQCPAGFPYAVAGVGRPFP